MSSTDWMIGIAAVITAAMPGYLAWLQTKKTHKTINSRMDELMRLTAESSRAKGRLEGAAEEKAARTASLGQGGCQPGQVA